MSGATLVGIYYHAGFFSQTGTSKGLWELGYANRNTP